MQKLVYAILFVVSCLQGYGQTPTFIITQDSPTVINPSYFEKEPEGGDTVYISDNRTQALVFEGFNGNETTPLVFINSGGLVNINSFDYWSALEFKNCRYIKVSGKGTEGINYGFKLSAQNSGVAFTELSSNCELEFVHIDFDGFVGIQAKKDYHGVPPNPTPVFEKLVIHDCLVENVSEGMYLGETTTPGMEFRHIRIFNNILYNTKREGIQIANAVEDVEIYNNLILNSGTDRLFSQGNNLQIGDNTKANVYDNIMMNAFENGVIVLGAGDISMENNYFSYNKGLFIDNRSVSIEDADIIINNNHFYGIIGEAIVTNQNELNPINLYDNIWYGSSYFLKNNSGNTQNLKEWNNVQRSFIPLELVNPEAGDFSLSPDNSEIFKGMGPLENNSYVFNYQPVLYSVGNYFIDWDEDSVFYISASVADNDILTFTIENLPDFVTLEEVSNGRLKLSVNPDVTDFGKYPVKISVSDLSHEAKAREKINIAIRNPQNQPPNLEMVDNYQMETLSSETIFIDYSDPNNDTVQVTANNLPHFAELIKNGQNYYIRLMPRYIDVGVYENIQLTVNDGFGLYDSIIFTVEITPKKLLSGMPVFRVNCGGPEIEDTVLNWEGAFYETLPYEINDNHHTGSHTWSGINTTVAPDNLFGPWCFDYAGGDEMKWVFPCENGTYIVNLFFAEIESDVNANGPVVCDIKIQDNTVAENFNIFAEAGLKALKKSFEVVNNNGQIEIEFMHVVNNPKLSGIEIVFVSSDTTTANATLYLKPDVNSHIYTIYPNPASNFLNINFSEAMKQQKVKIELLNMEGKTLLNHFDFISNKKTVHIPFDRTRFQSGAYLVKISAENGYTVVQPIIIQ